MRRSCVAVLLVVATGCPSDDVDPGDLTISDVRGRWARKLNGGAYDRIMTLQEHAVFHPNLVDATNVFSFYEAGYPMQSQLIMGTYSIEDGVLVQSPVWSENGGTFPPGASALRNRILSFTRGEHLSIEAADFTESRYEKIDTCEVPVFEDGWRHYYPFQSTWQDVPNTGVGREPTTITFTPDGAIIGSMSLGLTRYAGECAPETVQSLGDVMTARAGGGAHVLLGRQEGGTMLPLSYMLVASESRLRLPDARPVPGDSREVVAIADVGGKAVILFATATGPVIARDDGASFVMSNVGAAPASFIPRTIVGLGDHVAILGTGNANLLYAPVLLEEGAGGFTATDLPFGNVDYFDAAADGDDLWVVFSKGVPVGGSRPSRLWVAKRSGGTWSTPVQIGLGAEPKLAVRNGVAHVVGLHLANPLNMLAYYSRISGTVVDQWLVPPRGGSSTGASSSGTEPPGLDVAPDGTIAAGFSGQMFVRHPGERDLRSRDVRVTITGAGRIVSADGLIDCTQSCNVTAEVGRMLVLEATAAGGGPGMINGSLSTDRQYHQLDIRPPVTGDDAPLPLVVTFP